MPQQFIKVKGSSRVISREAFSESVKKQDFSKCDSDSNYSNSTADICRICHCEADTENPLLSPCYCAGSLKYVHQNCLRQWLAASDTRSCELCKFNFILHTKIKPLSEWRILEMSSVERRRLLCAILFHFVAAVCVIWSLFVLIDRAAEEVQKGLIAWPFWTKLVVVAVGFTGGAVFMYIQCRQYLHLFSRWRAHNRIILVQNAPEKPSAIPPSPTYPYSKPFSHNIPNQIVTQVEYNLPQQIDDAVDQSNDIQVCYVFDLDRMASVQKADVHVEDLCDDSSSPNSNLDGADKRTIGARDFNASRVVSNDLVALDIDLGAGSSTNVKLNKNKTDNCRKSGGNGDNMMYKSLPNISTSSENLLV